MAGSLDLNNAKNSTIRSNQSKDLRTIKTINAITPMAAPKINMVLNMRMLLIVSYS